ncbi:MULTISPECIES: MbtH family protein [Pseudomonas]|uniref:MbtH family protein n=1 Tax=Pseudomonas TaxID=286 RepID=UPI002445FCE2|nr:MULTISPECIES: MbtH family protein [Pseudomonas]NCE86324.1 MbtH family protein [Pseudomonas sp. Q1]
MNPFDNEDGQFLVLSNDEGQHSLWPAFSQVPDGWQVLFGAAPRQDCVTYIAQSWTDMRPASLRQRQG